MTPFIGRVSKRPKSMWASKMFLHFLVFLCPSLGLKEAHNRWTTRRALHDTIRMKSVIRGSNLETVGLKFGFEPLDVSGPPGTPLPFFGAEGAAWGLIKGGGTRRAQNDTSHMKSLTRGPNLENAGPKYGFLFPDASGPPGTSVRLCGTDVAAWVVIRPGTTQRAQNDTIHMKSLMRGPKPDNAGPQFGFGPPTVYGPPGVSLCFFKAEEAATAFIEGRERTERTK